MENKRDWRYVPSHVFTRMHGIRPVARIVAYPPNQHPEGSPLVKECTAIQAFADTGESSWYGVDGAMINSQLRMIAHGGFINPRNELAKAKMHDNRLSWKKVPAKLVPPQHR